MKKDRTEEIRRRAEEMTETFFGNEKEYERGYMLGTINAVLTLAAEREKKKVT
ncbi:unknown [Clostridium sp. CAG:149]|nr:unknown [Clostridium sp. CAG:149]